METFKRLALAIVFSGLIALVSLGCGSSASSEEASPELQKALSGYRDYLRENAAELSRRIETMSAVIERETGKEPTPGAESVYPGTRVSYGHIDPFAQLYPALARRIDGLEDEVTPDEYGGFHAIEKQFFWQKVTYEMGPIAKQLGADVEDLRERIDSADPQPAEIVTGASKVASGIVEDVFPGEAEPWSHIDLVDAAAETEGVEAAFGAIEPLLAEENPRLTKRIEAQIREALDAVGAYGTPANDAGRSEPLRAGTRFTTYDQVTHRERWELAEPFKRLAKLLAEAEAELGA